MKSNKPTEQISSVQVTKLFGRFDHELVFDDDQDISIVTAPNGYGKTVLLRIIDSVFNRKLHFFRKITFENVQINLKSGKSILISKAPTDSQTNEEYRIEIQTLGFGDDNSKYSPRSKIVGSALRHLERRLPIEQVAPNQWFDFVKERTFTTDEIFDIYAEQLPQRLLTDFKLPEWLQNAIEAIDVHLVETQRLLYLEEPDGRRASERRTRTTFPSVVEKDAIDLAERIGRLLQQYANESQKLDQTFPKRIIEFRDGNVGDESEIRANLQELTQKRDALVSVGLLGKTISEPIRPSDIFQDESIRKILSIYVNDTRTKLSIFDEAYDKIKLFKQIIEGKFSFKEIYIDPEQGIRAVDTHTQKNIPLSDLSSGEQHELVLVYELLFKVKEGSVILVDEPELSLHVAWQKRFISDLQKIQELKSMSVLIATHSPQIINDKWDLVQELKA